MEKIEKFDKWMRSTVKSIYYYDHEKMSNAYDKIKR